MVQFTTIEDVLPGFLEATKQRPKQAGAIICATEAIEQGRLKCSIQLPPRYGKSDFARAVIAWCVESGISLWGLIVTTSIFLREQAVAEKDMQAFRTRFGYGGNFSGEQVSPGGPHPDLIDGYRPDPRSRVVSVTIQSFVGERENDEFEADKNSRKANLLKLIRQHAASGKRLLMIADECHMMSQSKAFGKFLTECCDAGAIVLTMTGTFYRSDDEAIFGAETTQVGERERQRVVTSAGSTPETITITTFKDQLDIFSNTPNFSCSLSEAWMEGVLCQLEEKWIEVPHEDAVTGRELKLSDMSPYEAQKRLWKIVRDPRVIKSGVEMLGAELEKFKAIDPKFRAIVFCGNDREADAQDNDHPRAIKNAIHKHAPLLHTQIVTGNDNGAAKLIQAFRDGPSCDVLIVKQMGGVGLDVPELKVTLDLSTIRTKTGCTQRWLRGCTKHPKSGVAVIILPQDAVARERYKEIVTDNGGGYTTEPIRYIKKINEREVPKQPDPIDTLIINGAHWGGTSDDRLREFNDDVTGDFIQAWMRKIPNLRGAVTEPQLAQALHGIPFKIVRDDESAIPTNIADERGRLKLHLRDLVEKILQGRGYAYKKIPDDLYAKAKAETWTELKKGAGLYGKYSSNELKDITDVDDLRKLDVFAQDLFQKETLHGRAV